MIDDSPRYMISVAAQLVGMHPQTLRIYETKGLVQPKRTPGNTRLYSEADLERLRTIQQLTDLGLNLAGVERVIAMQDQLARMQARLDRMERRLREEIEAVHKHYRRDLVPYSQTTELLPTTPRRRWTSTS
jgi:MerR family transcriptional regulator, heat shock protein HspR